MLHLDVRDGGVEQHVAGQRNFKLRTLGVLHQKAHSGTVLFECHVVAPQYLADRLQKIVDHHFGTARHVSFLYKRGRVLMIVSFIIRLDYRETRCYLPILFLQSRIPERYRPPPAVKDSDWNFDTFATLWPSLKNIVSGVPQRAFTFRNRRSPG